MHSDRYRIVSTDIEHDPNCRCDACVGRTTAIKLSLVVPLDMPIFLPLLLPVPAPYMFVKQQMDSIVTGQAALPPITDTGIGI